MRLLFDQNISHRLIQTLQQEYPDSRHVRDEGLRDAADAVVWQYAAQHGFVIVTKDADFHQRSILLRSRKRISYSRLGGDKGLRSAHH